MAKPKGNLALQGKCPPLKKKRECARVKPWSKPARVLMKPFPLAATPNHPIHVDVFGPLKVTEGGKKYV